MECKICHKDFKNLNGLSAHITKTHKYISQQEYYDKYLRPENYKNICPTCGKLTEFISIGYGYKTHCNRFCSNKDLSIIQQRHDTINTLYGGHALCFKETQDKCKQTTLQRYGVNNAYQINSIKEKAHSTQAVEKHYQTMKQNKTFKTSKQEDKCYELLTQIFSQVERNYKSTQYPFRCDFYISQIDCYVECNFHQTHGSHWYNENNAQDKLTYNKWLNKSKYFQNALITWTIRDIEKRMCAKNNNLNYVVLWSINEFYNWSNDGFPIRHDF